MKRPDLRGEISDLAALSREDLRARWAKSYGCDPPSHISAQLLQASLAYKLQADALGGLSRVAVSALKQSLTSSAPSPARRPRVGAQLIREWNGVTHIVDVLDGGFRYRGKIYRSLTAIALEITGAKWSGPRFFGLKTRGGG